LKENIEDRIRIQIQEENKHINNREFREKIKEA